MTRGEVEYAIRQAHNCFDRWNDVTGVIPKLSPYYYEILGVVEDAARIGARVACGLAIAFDEVGNLIDDATTQEQENHD